MKTIIHIAFTIYRAQRGGLRIVHARTSRRRTLQCRVCLAIRDWLIAHNA